MRSSPSAGSSYFQFGHHIADHPLRDDPAERHAARSQFGGSPCRLGVLHHDSTVDAESVLNTGAGLVRVADEIARLLVQTGLIGLRSEQVIRPLPMSLAGISSFLVATYFLFSTSLECEFSSHAAQFKSIVYQGPAA